jgi:hypothetical protein
MVQVTAILITFAVFAAIAAAVVWPAVRWGGAVGRVAASAVLAPLGFFVGLGTVLNLSAMLFMDYRHGLGPFNYLLTYGTGLLGLAVPWLPWHRLRPKGSTNGR